MPSFPKFEQKIQQQIVKPNLDQSAHPTYGIVLDYDSYNNTATVMVANKGSDEPGEIFRDIPCPVQLGVQSVAPEPGRPCSVTFKDNNQNFPMISSFFNHVYSQTDYQRQTKAVNALPRFMLEI